MTILSLVFLYHVKTDYLQFTDEAGSDGIHRDGTFLQHKGILYNGNYGKDLVRQKMVTIRFESFY